MNSTYTPDVPKFRVFSMHLGLRKKIKVQKNQWHQCYGVSMCGTYECIRTCYIDVTVDDVKDAAALFRFMA